MRENAILKTILVCVFAGPLMGWLVFFVPILPLISSFEMVLVSIGLAYVLGGIQAIFTSVTFCLVGILCIILPFWTALAAGLCSAIGFFIIMYIRSPDHSPPSFSSAFFSICWILLAHLGAAIGCWFITKKFWEPVEVK
jgi:hypothetical protein